MQMTQLNQIIAVEKGVRKNLDDTITRLYHQVQNEQPFSGITRTYKPKAEDGDQLPAERTNVQVKAEALLTEAMGVFERLIDVVATKDNTNCFAKADIVLENGTMLAADVPVTTLLYLEKQFTDVRTLITKLPVLDPSKEWSFDEAVAVYRTEPVQTTRTKKVLRNHVKSEATDKFPAQVETYTEDEIIGNWDTMHFSGALPQTKVNTLLAHADEVLTAIKFAREKANVIEVAEKKIGRELTAYILS
jgi:hypothetical protein